MPRQLEIGLMICMASSACRPEPGQAPDPLACPPCPACAAEPPLLSSPASVGPASAVGSGPGGDAAPTPAGPAAPPEVAARYQHAPSLLTLTGRAAYYSDRLAGRPTASGEPYEPRAFTAAHRELGFGTIVRVTPQAGGPVVYVRINDRGPFGDESRIIDLSRAAAEHLGMIRAGVIPVRVEVVEHGPR